VAPLAPASTANVAPPPVASAPARRDSLPPYVAVAGGIGLAGVVVFAVAGAMNRSTYGGLQEGCPASVCAADRQAEIDRGRTEQTVANVGLVVGLVGLGAGATLFVLDHSQRGGASAHARGAPDPRRAFGPEGGFRRGPSPAPNPHQTFGADVSLRVTPQQLILGGRF
jgi:hypothetical protein